MTPGEIARRRMHAQRLWGRGFASPVEVVRWFGAMQAQEYPFAKWAIAQRMTKSIASAAIDDALAEGTIVRTHILRPTWHFVLPEDLRWLLAINAPRVHQLNAYYYRQFDLDAKALAKTDAVLARAVEGGAKPTRKELAEMLDASGVRLACILMHAELEGILTSGGLRGKQHTYASFEERVRGKKLSPDAALAELTRRFFVARGPATAKDFATWASFTLTTVKRGLALVDKDLEHVECDGTIYYFVDGKSAPGGLDLVQIYDEIIMSYTESKNVLGPRSSTVRMHSILRDGRLVGHWKPNGDGVSTELFAELREALPVERYLRFVRATSRA